MAYDRDKHLRKKYGITLAEYNHILWDLNNGICPICGKNQNDAKQAFHVDHNHKTGRVRDIICGYCNRFQMMHIHDNPKRAIGLANYLLKHFRGD